MKRILFSIALVATSLATSGQTSAPLVQLPMTIENGFITETISGEDIAVVADGTPAALDMPGAVGRALRLDGYSHYATASIPAINGTSVTSATISLWCAPETFPVMAIDAESTDRALIAGNIDETAKTGWGFFLGRDGIYSFKMYAGGWPMELVSADRMPCYEWNHLVAVIDGSSKKVTLYNNGTQVAKGNCTNTFDFGSHDLWIGRGETEVASDGFSLNAFNGLIDDLDIYPEAVDITELDIEAENEPDLVWPETRYAQDLMRPRFHGMPSGAWTNECHGLTVYDGQYHLFFQKNANGPYMTRLQWGHIVSDDLLTWTEQPIVLFADTDYDQKGCWSGATFCDDVLTGGKPNIFYTAVDYEKATIAQASPDDDDLLSWTKNTANPIISGAPSGLSDDFRDPHVFKGDDDNYYMIVGTSKNDLGACTLHRYDTSTGSWSNDGSIFFQAASSTAGRFWEMPTMEKIDGQWLFTSTPLDAANGTETMYWTGTLNSDGSFNATSTTPSKVELEGMSSEGYGLLSPAIMQEGDKTIAIGIVPDKLDGSYNRQLGYSHTYSLPREWSINDEGELVQQPYSGLTALRTGSSYSASGATSLNSGYDISDVSGRMVEVQGSFVLAATTEKVGFELLKNSTGSLKLYYDHKDKKVVVDLTTLSRWSNDAGVFDGVYSSVLPRTLVNGESITLHAYLDHSILDVFINDTWAFSLRVFATDSDATGVAVIADGTTTATAIDAWTLSPETSSTDGIATMAVSRQTMNIRVENGKVIAENGDADITMSLYSIDGRKLAQASRGSHNLTLPYTHGIAIVSVSSAETNSCKKIAW